MLYHYGAFRVHWEMSLMLYTICSSYKLSKVVLLNDHHDLFCKVAARNNIKELSCITKERHNIIDGNLCKNMTTTYLFYYPLLDIVYSIIDLQRCIKIQSRIDETKRKRSLQCTWSHYHHWEVKCETTLWLHRSTFETGSVSLWSLLCAAWRNIRRLKYLKNNATRMQNYRMKTLIPISKLTMISRPFEAHESVLRRYVLGFKSHCKHILRLVSFRIDRSGNDLIREKKHLSDWLWS